MQKIEQVMKLEKHTKNTLIVTVIVDGAGVPRASFLMYSVGTAASPPAV